jgi:hypothetical protein
MVMLVNDVGPPVLTASTDRRSFFASLSNALQYNLNCVKKDDDDDDDVLIFYTSTIYSMTDLCCQYLIYLSIQFNSIQSMNNTFITLTITTTITITIQLTARVSHSP